MTAPRKTSAAPAAIVIAAAVLVAAPFAADFEGLRTRPYLDPAKIPTVCYGETQLEMRVYSPDECGKLLRVRMGRDYAPAILKCVPGFIDPKRRNAFAASIDAAYNAGPAAFCRSRMARSFNAGRWIEGCKGFPGWYVTARVYGTPVVFKGLVRRRIAERDLCLRAVG